MTTYTNPWTFARIVVDLLGERGWKIKSGRSSGDLGIQSYSLPDGTVSVGGRGGALGKFDALMALCEKFAAKHQLPIKWDREKFKEKYGEGVEPSERPWRRAEEDPMERDVGNMFDQVFGRAARSSFNWGVPNPKDMEGHEVKFKVPKMPKRETADGHPAYAHGPEAKGTELRPGQGA